MHDEIRAIFEQAGCEGALLVQPRDATYPDTETTATSSPAEFGLRADEPVIPSAEACARVRAVMAKQLTRNRLASAFRPPVRVAAKSGSLMGIVRNEIGVVTYLDGHRYAAAVFTRSQPGADEGAISPAIGAAAARAVAVLSGDHPMR
ncbi:serine hydrolase [Actinocrinis sp.]|uniref:serine hydrolase n=1 Tax=Actinocrinis sp. TaxID=1920516 RepID=UPI002D50C6D6|nr:serine hydrolase [Actinocrinis sp.]HZP53148.1 serine hydrolase [Actinocrinis sp.]